MKIAIGREGSSEPLFFATALALPKVDLEGLTWELEMPAALIADYPEFILTALLSVGNLWAPLESWAVAHLNPGANLLRMPLPGLHEQSLNLASVIRLVLRDPA